MSKRPSVKVCCISSIEEAKLAIEFGAANLGFVGPMPSGPGVIEDELICKITKTIPPSISTFLLTSETDAQGIIAHYKKVHTSTIQLVDKINKQEYKVIRNELPHVRLVQVIHVMDDASISEAIDVSAFVDAILLDSGNPKRSVKELGGTGRTHNWELSKEIRKSISVPVFLAGGLNENNVIEAIETVQPFGVDLCSGVRTDGKLDAQKLKAFFEAVEEYKTA